MSFVAVAIGVGTMAVGAYSANKSAKAQQNAINAQTELANRPQRTALGSYFNPGGTSGLAPDLQGMQLDTLKGLPGYKSTLTNSFGTFNNNLASAKSEYMGNESPFMNSVLNPIREQQATAQGQLTSNLNRRGVTGSSIANNQMSNQQALFGRQLSDATSQTRQAQISQRLGIDEATSNAATNYVSNMAGIDQQTQAQLAQVFAQEMQQLGLNQQAIQNMLATTGMTLQNNQVKQESYGRAMMAGGGIMSGADFSQQPFWSGWGGGYTANAGNSAMAGTPGAALMGR